MESTRDTQLLQKIKVYPGANAEFTLYNDDGTTYAYENGDRQITTLRWDDQNGELTHEGTKAWPGSEKSLLEIVGR